MLLYLRTRKTIGKRMASCITRVILAHGILLPGLERLVSFRQFCFRLQSLHIYGKSTFVFRVVTYTYSVFTEKINEKRQMVSSQIICQMDDVCYARE